MKHIGEIIRQKRREKKKSAEYVGSKLTNPITKQAFAKKERTGNFSYELVKEIAVILECEMADFLDGESTKSVLSQQAACLPKTG